MAKQPTKKQTTRPAQAVPAPIATPNHKGKVYTGILSQAPKTNPIPANLANIITPQTPTYWCSPGTVIAGKGGMPHAGGGSVHCKTLAAFIAQHGGPNNMGLVQLAGYTPTVNNWGTSAGITWPFVRSGTYARGNTSARMAILNALWVQGTSLPQAAMLAWQTNPMAGTLSNKGGAYISPLASAWLALLSGVYNKNNSAGHTGNPLAKPLSVMVALNPNSGAGTVVPTT